MVVVDVVVLVLVLVAVVSRAVVMSQRLLASARPPLLAGARPPLLAGARAGALLATLSALAVGLAPHPAAAAGTSSGSPWQWPLASQPAIVRPFAPGPTPYSPGHYGADLAAIEGQDVHAAGEGQVTYAGLLAGRGVVVVSHGRLRTTYEPVLATVRVGDRVQRGTRLGTVGRGHACPSGTCLHWGLRRGDTYLDPVLLVRGPVRLLPADGGVGPSQRLADDDTRSAFRAAPVPGGPRAAEAGLRPTDADAELGSADAVTRVAQSSSTAAVAGRGPLAPPAPATARQGSTAPQPPGAATRLPPGGPTSSVQLTGARASGGRSPGEVAAGGGAALGLLAGLVLLGSRPTRSPSGGGASLPPGQPVGDDDTSVPSPAGALEPVSHDCCGHTCCPGAQLCGGSWDAEEPDRHDPRAPGVDDGGTRTATVVHLDAARLRRGSR